MSSSSVSVREMRGVRSCLDMHKRAVFLSARRHFMSTTPPLACCNRTPNPVHAEELAPPPIKQVNVACAATLPSCKPVFSPKCDFQPGSCFKREICPTFSTLLHNYTMYNMVLFMDIKHQDEARRQSTIESLQTCLEEFNNLLGPDFQKVLEPVAKAIVEVAQARLTDDDIEIRQLMLNDAMEKLRGLSNMLGLYFGSMGRENPRLCKDEKLLCCIRDGWGIVVNSILEMVYCLEEDDRDASSFNLAAVNAFHGATVFGKFLDQLCLRPKEPCPNGVTMFDDSKRTIIQRGVPVGDLHQLQKQQQQQQQSSEPEQLGADSPVTIGEMMEKYDTFSVGVSLHDIVAEYNCTESDQVALVPASPPYTTIAGGASAFGVEGSPITSSQEFLEVKVKDSASGEVLATVLSKDVDDDSNVQVARNTLVFQEGETSVSGILFTFKKRSRINHTEDVIDLRGEAARDLKDLVIDLSLIWRYEYQGGKKEAIQVHMTLKGVTSQEAGEARGHFRTERAIVTTAGNVYVVVATFNFATINEQWKQLTIGDLYVFSPDFKDRLPFMGTFGSARDPVMGSPSSPSPTPLTVQQEITTMIGAEKNAAAAAAAAVPVTFSGLSTKVQKLDAVYKVQVGKISRTLSDGGTKIRKATLSGTVKIPGADRDIVSLAEKVVFIGRYTGGGASGDKLLFLQSIGARGGGDFIEFPIKGKTTMELDLRLEVVEEDELGKIRGAQEAGGRTPSLKRELYAVRGSIELTARDVDKWDGKYQSTSVTASNGRSYVVRVRVVANDASVRLHGELNTDLYGVGSIAFLISDSTKDRRRQQKTSRSSSRSVPSRSTAVSRTSRRT